jgi:hypothetical protein
MDGQTVASSVLVTHQKQLNEEITTLGCSRKSEGRLGRPRYRWEDNIKRDLREIRFESVDWIHLAQGMHQWQAVVNTVMKLLVK